MSDLINRQAAIDAVLECYDNNELFEVYEDKLRALPSAEPTFDARDTQYNLQIGTDLISRAQAQTELQFAAKRYTVAHEAHGEGKVVWSESLISVSDAMDVLRKIPSAQPKRGKWHYSNGKPATIGRSFGVICDQCGIESEYCTNFCGECGADMREVTNE